MRQTFSGHFEIRSHKQQGDWYHLQVYEERNAPPVIVAAECPRGAYESLATSAADLATRAFWRLVPYARDDFRWFEWHTPPTPATAGGRDDFYHVTFSLRDSSGGPQLTKPHRTATTAARIEALIGGPLAVVACAEGETPERGDDLLDDPWYLPPDTPIPVTFQLDDGRRVHATAKAERARRLHLLEEQALLLRERLLGS